jgi:PBP1b-binding outer membrane lipoprotein LpoB
MRLLYSFIALIILLSACSKKITPPTVIPTPPPVTTLDLQEIDFDYFHGKARVNFKDDKKEREVKAAIRIRKDSVIWMTFSVIGVQGGKALINKDSITIVSTMDKEYYVFDYPELSKRFNFTINYDVVQSAMLGNLIQPKSADDKVIKETSFNILDQTQGTVQIKNYINTASTKLERVEMTESNTNNSMTINYRNFQPLNDKVFPYDGVISLFYKTAAGVLNNTIEVEYNKAEVGDKELKFPFNIPRKYARR